MLRNGISLLNKKISKLKLIGFYICILNYYKNTTKISKKKKISTIIVVIVIIIVIVIVIIIIHIIHIYIVKGVLSLC